MNSLINATEQRGHSDLPSVVFDAFTPDPHTGFRTIYCRMAKADEDDISQARTFFEACEEFFENETCEVLKPTPEVVDPDEYPPAPLIEAEEFLDLLRAQWNRGVYGWRRVVWGCDIMIRSACDPNADTLEFRPEIQRHLDRDEALALFTPV